MVEPGILDSIFASIGHAPWPVLIGYLVLLVVGVGRWLTEGALPDAAEDWVSAVSALLGGLGLALAAGGVWWQVAAIAILAAPSSSGFWRLVRVRIASLGGGGLK